MRKSIPAGEKLALTLRYLATGEFICPALFTSIMAKQASLGDRISPKASLLKKQSASQYYHKKAMRTAEETASNGTEYLVAGSHHSFTR